MWWQTSDIVSRILSVHNAPVHSYALSIFVKGKDENGLSSFKHSWKRVYRTKNGDVYVAQKPLLFALDELARHLGLSDAKFWICRFKKHIPSGGHCNKIIPRPMISTSTQTPFVDPCVAESLGSNLN